MKIAYIVAKFPELSETFVVEQMIGLMNLGNEIDVYAYKKGKTNSFFDHRLREKGLQNRIHYFNVPARRWDRLMRVLGILMRNMTRLGKVFKCVDLKRDSLHKMINTIVKAESFLNKDYDVVHCHFGPIGKEMIFLKRIMRRDALFAVTFHGYDLSSHLKAKGQTSYGALFREGDLFFPISRFWAGKIESMGCDAGRIHVTRMGVDVKKFSYREKPVFHEPVRLLTVGRLVEKKGHQYALLALKEILKMYPRIRYTIAGEGALGEEIQQQITQLGIRENVEYLGKVSHDRVNRLMEDADLFLLPSVTAANGDMEGIPVVLMEAMAKGLPVISTRHSGIPELIKDEENGLLADERDAGALARHVEHLISDDKFRLKLSRRARRTVEQEFNSGLWARELNAILENTQKSRGEDPQNG